MRKGTWYTAMLVVIILLAAVVVVSQLLTKVSVTRFIGDAQGPVMSVNADARLFEAFLRESAMISMDKVVRDVASYPQLQGLQAPTTIAAGYCSLLNDEKTPTKLALIPFVGEGISTAFNNQMNSYLKQYADKAGWEVPQNNFEVFVEKGKFTAVSVRPVRFPIKDFAGKVVGNASFRPSFVIGYDHKFEEYPVTFQQLEKIASSCSYSADPKKCAEDIKLSNWAIEEAGDHTFKFTAQHGKPSSCYLLLLPT